VNGFFLGDVEKKYPFFQQSYIQVQIHSEVYLSALSMKQKCGMIGVMHKRL
jgi:hypothetical protein